MAKKSSSGVKVEMTNQNRDNFTNAPFMMDVCRELAETIKSNAEKMSGGEYAIDSYYGGHRVHVMVAPNSWAAINDNKQNNTLLKAMGG